MSDTPTVAVTDLESRVGRLGIASIVLGAGGPAGRVPAVGVAALPPECRRLAHSWLGCCPCRRGVCGMVDLADDQARLTGRRSAADQLAMDLLGGEPNVGSMLTGLLFLMLTSACWTCQVKAILRVRDAPQLWPLYRQGNGFPQLPGWVGSGLHRRDPVLVGAPLGFLHLLVTTYENKCPACQAKGTD